MHASAGPSWLGPIPYATLLVAVLACLTWMLLKHLQWGRWIYAIGGNPDAAARVGIPVNRVLVSVYVLSGLAAGVAGIITAGQIGVGDANAGLLSELDAIAAVMIGGASFLGGRGSCSRRRRASAGRPWWRSGHGCRRDRCMTRGCGHSARRDA